MIGVDVLVAVADDGSEGKVAAAAAADCAKICTDDVDDKFFINVVEEDCWCQFCFALILCCNIFVVEPTKKLKNVKKWKLA